jgi:hypothetical protein
MKVKRRGEMGPRRRERFEAGLCRACPAPRGKGVFCEAHAEENRAKKRAHDAQRKAEGICQRCSRPATEGRFCAGHAKLWRRYFTPYFRDWRRAHPDKVKEIHRRAYAKRRAARAA